MEFETLITGYEIWIQQLLKQEWDVCYVMFEFNHLSSNQKIALVAPGGRNHRGSLVDGTRTVGVSERATSTTAGERQRDRVLVQQGWLS